MDDIGVGEVANQVMDAFENRPRRVVRSGTLFVDDKTARPEMDKVGEGATGIDAET